MDENLHTARIRSVGSSTIPNRSEPYAVDLKRALIDHGFPRGRRERRWSSERALRKMQHLHRVHFLRRRNRGKKMPEVLLADDNPSDVYLIREALREHGVDCILRVASDGKEALSIISGEVPDAVMGRINLIILDLNLPRHDGIEILQKLRESAGLEHVPVVVLTSSDSPRDRILAEQLGATRYLRKPSSLDEFLNLGAVFKDLLGQTKSTSDAQGGL
jgi:chemotaxis family two-component system response regulator Rcp1